MSGNTEQSNVLLLKAKINAISFKYFGSQVRDLVDQTEKRASFYKSIAHLIDSEEIFEQKIISFVDENLSEKMKKLHDKANYWVSKALFEQGYNLTISVIIRSFKNAEEVLFSENTTVSHVINRIHESGFDLTQMVPLQTTHSKSYDVIC